MEHRGCHSIPSGEEWGSECVYIYRYRSRYILVSEREKKWMNERTSVSIYVSMYLCMHVCINVDMYKWVYWVGIEILPYSETSMHDQSGKERCDEEEEEWIHWVQREEGEEMMVEWWYESMWIEWWERKREERRENIHWLVEDRSQLSMEEQRRMMDRRKEGKKEGWRIREWREVWMNGKRYKRGYSDSIDCGVFRVFEWNRLW